MDHNSEESDMVELNLHADITQIMDVCAHWLYHHYFYVIEQVRYETHQEVSTIAL